MDAKNLGSFIAAQRKSLGLTQAELAEKLHVTDKAVSRWERGLGFPDINLIEPLANALKVSIAEIMKSEKNIAALSDGDAPPAAKNVIRTVDLKRGEQKKTAVVIFRIALLLFCIFLIDVMGPMGFIGAALPCFGLTAGIVLCCAAAMRRRRKLPIKITVFWAAALAAVPVIFAVLFFAAGALGAGPTPN